MSAQDGLAPQVDEPIAPNGDEFLALLRDCRLTPAQRRIARYLLEHRDEVSVLSSGDLSTRVGVSQPSVSRFAQALGFGGYPELRQYLHATGAQRRAATRSPADGSTRFQQTVDLEVENLRRLSSHNFDPALRAAGELLSASPTIVVLGLRASEPLARYFAFFAGKVHPDVRLVTTGGSCAKDGIDDARAAGARVMLCLALPRCPRETVAAFDFAVQAGLETVLITDDDLGHLARRATYTLTAKVATGLVFDSQAAPMLVVATLIDAMADADPTRTQSRLEEFESRAATEGYFDSP